MSLKIRRGLLLVEDRVLSQYLFLEQRNPIELSFYGELLLIFAERGPGSFNWAFRFVQKLLDPIMDLIILQSLDS